MKVAIKKALIIEIISLSLCLQPLVVLAQPTVPGAPSFPTGSYPPGSYPGGYGGGYPGGGYPGGGFPPNNAGYMPPAGAPMGGALSMINPFMGTPGAPGNFNNPAGNMFSGSGMGPMAAMMALGTAGSLATQSIQWSAQTAMTARMMEMSIAQQQQSQALPDSVFPQCRTMPAQDSHLSEMACAPNSIRHEGDKMHAFMIINIAEKQKANYDVAVMEGKAVNNSVGLQCFQEQKKRLLDKVARDREALKARIDDITQMMNKQKVDLQNQIADIEDVTNELNGFQGPGSASDRKRDFTQIFGDEQCSMVLDKARDLNASVGLYGIRDLMRQSQTTVDETLVNIKTGLYQEKVKQDIERLVQRDKTDVSSVDGLNFSISDGFFSTEKQVTNSKYNQLKSRLQQVTGIQLPENIQSYERGLEAGQLPSKDYLQQQVIKDRCFNNAQMVNPPSSVMTKLQQIVDGRYVPETQSRSLEIYKAKLEKIFAKENMTPQQMIDAVEALERESGNDQFRAKMSETNAQGITGNESHRKVSDILQDSLNYCNTWFHREPAIPGSPMSWNDLISQEMNSLQNMKSEISSSNDDITRKLQDRILSCKGVNFNPSPRDCNAGYFDISANPNFCIPNAEKCANSFKSCMAKAAEEIKVRENKRTKMVGNYNEGVKKIVDQQNKLMKMIAAQVEEQAKALTNYFPGTSFKRPQNMFLDTMAEVNTPHGKLAGGGNLDFLAQASAKFTEMIQSMEEQEQLLKTSLDQRENAIKQRFTAEANYWKGIIPKCQQAITTFEQGVMQANQRMMQQQQQQQQQMMRLCTQLQNSAVGPGCQGQAQNLSNTMSQVAGYMGMGPEAWKIQQYNQTCNFMNSAQQMQSQDTILQSALGANFRLVDLCDNSDTQFVADRFNNYIAGNAWQIAAVLNQKHGAGAGGPQITPEVIKGCLDQAAHQPAVNCAGLGEAQLSSTPTGKYLASLLKLNLLLKDQSKQTIHLTDPNNASAKKVPQDVEGGFCSIIRAMTDHVRKNMNKPTYQWVGDAVKAASATPSTAFGGGQPISPAQASNDVFKNAVHNELNAMTPNENPVSKKFYEIGALIKNMAVLTNQLQADAGLHLTQAMGQNANMGCAAMYMNARNLANPAAGGGMFGDSQFNSMIRAGGI